MTDLQLALTLFGGFTLFVVFLWQVAMHLEKQEWNGGRCDKCGGPWQHFDTDSQGGLGYKCGCFHIWLSWHQPPQLPPVRSTRENLHP